MYKNIRTFQKSAHVATFDGDEQYLTLPPVPPPAPRDGSAPTVYYGWQHPNSSKINSFSAACWFFAQELTDIAVDKNQTPPILGLIESAWGGTEIDDWLRNDTISNCKNASGFPGLSIQLLSSVCLTAQHEQLQQHSCPPTHPAYAHSHLLHLPPLSRA